MGKYSRRPAKRKREAEAESATEEEEEGDDGNQDEEAPVYTGTVCPTSGEAHGRGTQTFVEPGARFEGRFDQSLRHGKGAMTFADGSSLKGIWDKGELNGLVRYDTADGCSMVGMYRDGEFSGPVEEFDEAGELVFRGNYKANVRSGQGQLFSPDGGFLDGEWTYGQFEGSCNRWYPCYKGVAGLYFEGCFKNGMMAGTIFVAPSTHGRSPAGNTQKKKVGKNGDSETRYTFEAPSSTQIAKNPTVRDPWETYHVHVAKSLVADGGEGLFASWDLSAHFPCSFYSGTLISQIQVDRRAWDLNNNTITLVEDDDSVIDVPGKYADTTHYCASLGHKVNHHFNPSKINCKYSHYHHPRFGHIKCILTLRPIVKDEELYVDYGYHLKKNRGGKNSGSQTTGPLWYRQGWNAWKLEQQRNDLL